MLDGEARLAKSLVRNETFHLNLIMILQVGQNLKKKQISSYEMIFSRRFS